MSEKLTEAATFLEGVLSQGPISTSALGELGEVHGHAWRTLRRAADAMPVVKVKQGQVWVWQLDGSPQPPRPKLRVVETALHPIPEPEPQPKPPASRIAWGPADRRGRGWAGGGFEAVRCAHCIHVGEIEDRGAHGYCPTGQTRLTYLFAQRRCRHYGESP